MQLSFVVYWTSIPEDVITAYCLACAQWAGAAKAGHLEAALSLHAR